MGIDEIVKELESEPGPAEQDRAKAVLDIANALLQQVCAAVCLLLDHGGRSVYLYVSFCCKQCPANSF
jgi:hypothetical protein